MKEESENYFQISTLLGLAASKKAADDTCPTDQQLALFVGGQLKKKAQHRFLAHMNRCPDCRQTWLESVAYLESIESKPVSSQPPFFSTMVQNIIDALSSWQLVLGGVTATILAILIWPSPSGIDQQINGRYELLAMQTDKAAYRSIETFSMPWDNAVMGFSQSRSDPQYKAFGAGLWTGRKNMLADQQAQLPAKLKPAKQNQWLDTEWSNFYLLGRWVILLWAETQFQEGAVDWEQHEQILQQWRAEAVEQTSNQDDVQAILVSLEPIGEKLALLQSPQNQHERESLRRLLEMFMQKYSPD